MRVNQSTSARAAYYDRVVQNRSIRVNPGYVAPHGDTLRATYTVPNNRKAFVDALFIHTKRSGVPTVTGLVWAWVEYTPSGGGPAIIALVQHYDATLHSDKVFGPSPLGVLLPGDTLDFYTADESTGGTMDYLMTAKILEFEA